MEAHSAWGKEEPALSTASCEHALTIVPCLSAVQGPTASRPILLLQLATLQKLVVSLQPASGLWSLEMQEQKWKEELGKAKDFFFVESFFCFFLLGTLGHELCLKVAQI